MCSLRGIFRHHLRAYFVDETVGEGAERDVDEDRKDNGVVEISEHRDEIGDYIDRRKGVCDGRAEADAGEPGAPRVGDHAPVDPDFVFEAGREGLEGLATHNGKVYWNLLVWEWMK